jgi:hypothetical protein
MPFAPQWLSLIQPVHVIVLFSAKVARLIAASITASRLHMLMALFMFTSLLRVNAAFRRMITASRPIFHATGTLRMRKVDWLNR